MKKQKPKMIRTELMIDGDTNEWQMVIGLGTKSEGAAKIKAQRLIRKFNNALKPASSSS